MDENDVPEGAVRFELEAAGAQRAQRGAAGPVV